MTKHNPTDKSAQGADGQNPIPTPDVETIKKWLTDDLGRARSLLEAIHNSPDILNQIAIFMQGKIENYKNAPKTPPNRDK